jgi:hypothetical protein
VLINLLISDGVSRWRGFSRLESEIMGNAQRNLNGGITAQLWGNKVEAFCCKNHDSGGLADKD